jgi:hypothetical protein
LKSGGPSLGRSPGAHKQRRPAKQHQIQLRGEIGSTQFLEQGFIALLFFLLEQGLFLLEQGLFLLEQGWFSFRAGLDRPCSFFHDVCGRRRSDGHPQHAGCGQDRLDPSRERTTSLGNREQERRMCTSHFRIAPPCLPSCMGLPSHWQTRTTECPFQTLPGNG